MSRQAHRKNCVCQDRSTPLTEKQRDAIGERLLNPGVFAPYGEAKGMVSENVYSSDFECCPEHPDRSSCPGDGCAHCRPITEKQRDANRAAFTRWFWGQEPTVDDEEHYDTINAPLDSVDDTKNGYNLHPFGAALTYVVVCFDGPGNYALAKRRVFKTRDEAQEVADSIPDTRDPLVIEGRWHQLFLPQNLSE